MYGSIVKVVQRTINKNRPGKVGQKKGKKASGKKIGHNTKRRKNTKKRRRKVKNNKRYKDLKNRQTGRR